MQKLSMQEFCEYQELLTKYTVENQEEFMKAIKNCSTDMERTIIANELMFANQLISYDMYKMIKMNLLLSMPPESKKIYIFTLMDLQKDLKEKFDKAYGISE